MKPYAWGAACLVVAVALLSIGKYRSGVEVSENYSTQSRTYSAWLGPSGSRLLRKGRTELRAALDDLNDPRRNGAEDLTVYRERLEHVAALYRRATLASALDGSAVLGLAAVECEAGILDTWRGATTCRGLLEIGQRREPFNMEFQMDLAETLLRAGETAAAQRVASRVVTLTPSYSRRALALLESFGIDPISAVTALGTTPPVLIAARDTFVEARLGDAFLTLAEAQLISAPHELIEAYGHVAFRQRAFERVIQALEPVETSAGPAAAVVQSRLLAEALLATGRVAEACERAQLAQGIDPGDPRVLEVLGDCLLASGRTADSVLSYRSALGIVVRGGASAGQMSRLYRKIGESYERAGEGDRAFDAYTKALELVPSDVLASMRLAFLTQNRGGGLRAR